MELTIKDFAELQNTTPENIRVMIHRNKLPDDYYYDRDRKVILKQVNETQYINPSKLTSVQMIQLNNAWVDHSGNIKKISETTNINYTTCYRFFKNQYKPKNEHRADKGVSRKLSVEQLLVAKKSFDYWFLKNAVKSVKLAIYKVKKETGYSIPRRLADQWVSAIKSTHKLKHYYKDFITSNVYHHKRDLWKEYENFLDCVVADVWKIDDPYIPEADRLKINAELDELKKKNQSSWERARTKSATAYALVFMDMKTRYPVEVAICPHSVAGADVKKAMLSIIMNWGDPKQWLLDNGKEFINKDTMDFLYGIYMGQIGEWIGNKREKKVLLKEDSRVINSTAHHPQSKGMIEAAFNILKTQWAGYSVSYSPNQFESRKPGVALSSVQPVLTFEELALSLREFVYGEFIEAERKMFLNPGLAESHPENKARPKTIKEAFHLAYGNFTKTTIDPYILSYYYADRRKATFSRGEVSFVDPNSKLKLHYVPSDFEAASNYAGQKLTVLMNPENIYHCWLFSDDKLICEAMDLRYDGMIMNKDRATTLGKIQRNIVAIEKKKMQKIEEYNSLKLVEVKSDENEDIVDTSTGEVLSSEPIHSEDAAGLDAWDCIDADDLTT